MDELSKKAKICHIIGRLLYSLPGGVMIRDTDRNPEEARKILVLMFLRAFWKENFMRIEMPAFHKSFGTLLALVRRTLKANNGNPREVSEMGFVLDNTLCRFHMLDEMLWFYEDQGFLGIEGGLMQVVVFNANTNRLVMRTLSEELVLTADENNLLFPLCLDAVKRYNKIAVEQSCD